MVLKLCSNNGPISSQRFASFKLPWQNAIEKTQNVPLRTKAGELQCCLHGLSKKALLQIYNIFSNISF